MEYTKFVDKLPIGTDSLREMVRTKISKTIQEKRPEEFQIGGTDGQARPVIAIDEINAEEISKLLLDVDHERADIDPYDEKILTDPNRGHWDLWTDGDADDGPVLDLSCQGYVARNPRADINKNRIDAIDFGTKSTVVVYQNEDSRILPVRVGTGNVSKSIRAEHYENPTIIEFNNLAVFLEAYGAALGRPATRWEDVYISHRAVDDLQSSRSTDYSAFFTELKQWAGDAGVKKSLRFRDRESNDYLIKPFHELSDTDLNPIELYAYYLGLYINNMRNGIFFNYYLSFPVTYEISVREKIAKSFERGIKKALPETLLKDEAVMKNFKINGSISEPAAYAVCALQEYGFEPMDDEVIFYSVFDFGGGTTDFDFGEWRESDSPKYDYT
ncbi:MAG: hypothetical protein K2N94_10445, partial [Lachnospiraceae bacterium]|nr:hypothetical protein [Lachnospiraceae bacterium]